MKTTKNPQIQNLHIRIDKNTKDQAQEILEKMGIDLSSAIKIFLNNVIITRAIPFEIKAENKAFRELAKENMKKELKNLNYTDLDENL